MADRTFKQFVNTADSRVVLLSGLVTLGASDAVSSSTLPFATVSNTGTGQFTVALADKYNSLLSVSVAPMLSSIVDLQWSFSVSKDSNGLVTGVVVQFATGAAAASVGSGNGFSISLALKNSNLPSGE